MLPSIVPKYLSAILFRIIYSVSVIILSPTIVFPFREMYLFLMIVFGIHYLVFESFILYIGYYILTHPGLIVFDEWWIPVTVLDMCIGHFHLVHVYCIQCIGFNQQLICLLLLVLVSPWLAFTTKGSDFFCAFVLGVLAACSCMSMVLASCPLS